MFVQEFQGIIGTIVGFAGVIITLIYNNNKERRIHQWKEQEERKIIMTSLRTEPEMFYSIAKNIHESEPFELGGGIIVPKRLPKSSVYHALIGKIGLLPANAAAKVVRSYVVIDEFPQKLRYAAGLVRTGEISATIEEEDSYNIRSYITAGRVAGLYGGLSLTIGEAIQELKRDL